MTAPSAHRGRPRTAALLSVADVIDVIADRREAELPVTAADVASDLAISRRSLVRVVRQETGLRWEPFILPFLRPKVGPNVDDEGMKRLTVTLDDATFKSLRRLALEELRDPRLEARRILERTIAERSDPERQPAESVEAAR